MPIIYQLEQNKNILKFIDNDFELQNTNIFTFWVKTLLVKVDF
jgi:hypothetical protein